MAPPRRPWFRFYVEAAGDRKLRRLAPAERWLWTMVLAAARQSPVPGVLLITDDEAMTVEELADFAGMKEREVRVGVEKMMGLGLVHEGDGGALVVTKWDVRQPESDDVTARTRRHRSKGKPIDDPPPGMERSIPVPPQEDGTFHERSGGRSKNVDGTHQKLEVRNRGFNQTQPDVLEGDGSASGWLAEDSSSELMDAAAGLAAQRETDRRSAAGELNNPGGYHRDRRRKLRKQHTVEWAEMLRRNPGLTVEDLADAAATDHSSGASSRQPVPPRCPHCQAVNPGPHRCHALDGEVVDPETGAA